MFSEPKVQPLSLCHQMSSVADIASVTGVVVRSGDLAEGRISALMLLHRAEALQSDVKDFLTGKTAPGKSQRPPSL